jgi:hypothetical protein
VTAKTWLASGVAPVKVAGTVVGCIPATPIDAFVGGTNAGRCEKKPGRSTSDNRGLACSFPALKFALQARAILLAFGNCGGSKNRR